MARDKRAFAQFDVGYLDNPKMMDVLDSSLHAICMHFASVLYCAQHLTDGIVAPRAMQRKVGASDNDAQILIEAGLWHAPGHSCGPCPQPPAGKVYVHDFLEHNRDAAEAKRVSKVRSEAAKTRWKGEAEADANCIATCTANEPCLQCREREKEREKEESREDVTTLCETLRDQMIKNGFKPPTITEAWKKDARLLLDTDKRELDKSVRLIQWAQDSSFWKSNIKSMGKFRKQYDTLRLQAVDEWSKGKTKFNVGEPSTLDVNAILGADHWACPAPPPGLGIQEEIAWKKAQRENRHAERHQLALKKLEEQNAATP